MLSLLTVNLSREAYKSKEEIESSHTLYKAKLTNHNVLTFDKVSISIEEFWERVTHGYAYVCALFDNQTEHGLKLYQKRKEHFQSSQIVSVDIDETKYSLIEDFVDVLEMKPTFYYSTYSDSPLQRKFRMVYVFDEMMDADTYTKVSECVHYKVSLDSGEVIKDDCGTRLTQYMNGTYGNGIDTELFAENIYSPSSFLVYVAEYCQTVSVLSGHPNNNIGGEEAIRTECPLNENEKIILTDFLTKPRCDFVNKYREECQLFLATDMQPIYECLIEQPAVNTPDGYLEWRPRFYRDEEGKCHLNKYKDGEGRRRKLFCLGIILRSIKPSITFVDLLFNMSRHFFRYFENDEETCENIITDKEIAQIVIDAYTTDLSSDWVKRYVSKLRQPKMKANKEYCVVNDVTARAALNIAKGQETERIIRAAYAPDLTYAEIRQRIVEGGNNVSQKTLQRYIKKMGLPIPRKKRISKKPENTSIILFPRHFPVLASAFKKPYSSSWVTCAQNNQRVN